MTTRAGLCVVLFVIAAFFVPRLIGGDVVFPHSNAEQVAAVNETTGEDAFGVRFSDESSFYVPELHAQLHGPRTGWIATWTDAVEMGRPLTHVSGFSPAYPPTWILSRFTEDAFLLYTLLAVFTIAATGAFAFLFFRALELDPWACVAGAVAAALGLPMLYWLTFLMNLSGFCWTFCCLWLVTSWLERPSAAKFAGIAGGVYALLLSGYPQMTVWQGAFVAAWTLGRVIERRSGARARTRALACIALAVVVGVIAVLPVYLDLFLAWSNSARTAVDTEYFLAALPEIHRASDVFTYFVTLFDPVLLGDARTSTYPMQFNGVAFGPFVALLVLLSWRASGWRKLRSAYAFLVLGLGMTMCPTLFRFGIEHLGLGLSRTVPSWGAIVPALLCATVAFDGLTRNRPRRAWIVTLSALALAGAAIAVAVTRGQPSSYIAVAAGVAALALVVHPGRGRFAGALACACAVVWIEGREFVLLRPRDSIQTSSELVQDLRMHTTGGRRFAIVGAEPRRVLPANQELLLGLASVHSYDSLSPRAYQEWVLRFSSGGARNYGRRFDRITDASRLDSPELDDMNLAVVLSSHVLQVPNLVPAGRAGPFLLYTPVKAPWRAKLVTSPLDRLVDGEVTIDENAPSLPVTIVEDRGDRLHLRFERQPREAVVWISRQAHPQWVADTGRTIRVNGFHQGVVVPAGTGELDLEFRPWVRWSWVPQLGFALTFLACGLSVMSKRRLGA